VRANQVKTQAKAAIVTNQSTPGTW